MTDTALESNEEVVMIGLTRNEWACLLSCIEIADNHGYDVEADRLYDMIKAAVEK